MSFMSARDFGSKPGSGGVASAQSEGVQRRERLRQLAMETIDLANDPYFMKNHIGQYECKLCLCLHNNEGSYMVHTQGKRHQQNLARRAAKLAKEQPTHPQDKYKICPKKIVKIGTPGYKVVKQLDRDSDQRSLLFQVSYPEIEQNYKPRIRIMSSYEQHVEKSDSKYQYLLFAAEPYENIAFKIPNYDIDRTPEKFLQHWDSAKQIFTVQIYFKNQINK